MAWAPVRLLGPSGVTPFQEACRHELEIALEQAGVALPTWVLHGGGTDEPYLVGPLPKLGAQIWIYKDGADVQVGDRHKLFEDWDAGSPEELRRKIVTFVTSLVVADRTQAV